MPEPHNSFELVQFETRLVAARLERAEQHFEAFGEARAAYLDTKPHRLVRTIEIDGTVVVRLERASPLPVELSIEFGELLYELRAALDNSLYAVAVITSGESPPPQAGRLEWPIRETAKEWGSQAKRYSELPPEIVAALEAIQPYGVTTPGWNCLAILHELARLDRHRSPHRLALYLSHVRCFVDPMLGDIVRVRESGVVEEGDELVRVRVNDGEFVSPENFDYDAEFEVEATDVRESIGPNGRSGRPWGSLDNRLPALIEATRGYAVDLIDLAHDHAAPHR